VTVIVNCGDTDSTVKSCDCECDPMPFAVPVTVMLYCDGVVVPVLLTVTVAPPDGFTLPGLTWHVGGSAATGFEVTRQVRSTVPLKPFSAPTVIFAAVVPPGSIAPGLGNVAMVRVKSCPNAAGKRIGNATRQRNTMPARDCHFNLGFKDSDLNMSRISIQ
jgi:hypothetical protein